MVSSYQSTAALLVIIRVRITGKNGKTFHFWGFLIIYTIAVLIPMR